MTRSSTVAAVVALCFGSLSACAPPSASPDPQSPAEQPHESASSTETADQQRESGGEPDEHPESPRASASEAKPGCPTCRGPSTPRAESSQPAFVPPPKSQHIPELKVITVGLHIGGGPNDDETRRRFKAPIELRFADFLACYRSIERPGAEGTFGVDLYLPRAGGRPTVRQVRTRIKGDDFRECVRRVFETTRFARPPKGPTVISYSLRYSVGIE